MIETSFNQLFEPIGRKATSGSIHSWTLIKRRMERRSTVKGIVVILILYLGVTIGSAIGEEKRDQPVLRLPLPSSRALSWSKPVKCTAIASAALFEETLETSDFKHGKLSVYVKKGTDRLRVSLENEDLIIQSGDQKPDRYRVSVHRNGYLVAIHHGAFVPALYSISVNENNGFAVWSLSESMLFPASQYPYAQSVYMQCTN
jgi:hypothetical protein